MWVVCLFLLKIFQEFSRYWIDIIGARKNDLYCNGVIGRECVCKIVGDIWKAIIEYEWCFKINSIIHQVPSGAKTIWILLGLKLWQQNLLRNTRNRRLDDSRCDSVQYG